MLEDYRQFRHDEMNSARFFKRIGNDRLMSVHLRQAQGWHNTIMQSWQAEKDEHNLISDIMRKYGIQPE